MQIPPCGTAAGALGKPKAAATTAHQRQRRITQRQFKVCAPEGFTGTSGDASKRLFFGSPRTLSFGADKRNGVLTQPPSPRSGRAAPFFQRQQKRFAVQRRSAYPNPVFFLSCQKEKGFGCPKEKPAWQSFGAFFCIRRAKSELTLPRAPLPLMQKTSFCKQPSGRLLRWLKINRQAEKATHNLIILNRTE